MEEDRGRAAAFQVAAAAVLVAAALAVAALAVLVVAALVVAALAVLVAARAPALTHAKSGVAPAAEAAAQVARVTPPAGPAALEVQAILRAVRAALAVLAALATPADHPADREVRQAALGRVAAAVLLLPRALTVSSALRRAARVTGSISGIAFSSQIRTEVQTIQTKVQWRKPPSFLTNCWLVRH